MYLGNKERPSMQSLPNSCVDTAVHTWGQKLSTLFPGEMAHLDDDTGKGSIDCHGVMYCIYFEMNVE